MDICEIVEESMEEIIESHLADKRENDSEYQKVHKRLLTASESIQELMEELSKEQSKTIMNYADLLNHVEGLNNSILYRAGMTDAVQLLKKLGVL